MSRRPLSVLVVLVTLLFALTSDAANPKVEISMDRELGRLVTDLQKYNRTPIAGDDVELGPGVEPVCAASAMRKTYAVLAERDVLNGAIRSFKLTLDIAKLALPIGKLGDVGEIVAEYMESTDAADFEQRVQNWVAKQVGKGALKGGIKSLLPEGVGQDFDDSRTAEWILDHVMDAVGDALKQAESVTERPWTHAPCDGRMTFQLVAPTKTTSGSFRVWVQGNCHCRWPDGNPIKLGEFSVRGSMALHARAVMNGKDISIVLTGDPPRYSVDKAVCNACGGEGSGSGVHPPAEDPSTTSTPSSAEPAAPEVVCPECSKWSAQEHRAAVGIFRQDQVLPGLRSDLESTRRDLAERRARLAAAEAERVAATNELKAVQAQKPPSAQKQADLNLRIRDLTNEIKWLKEDVIPRAETAERRQAESLRLSEQARARHAADAEEARKKREECEKTGCRPASTSSLTPRIELRVGPSFNVVNTDTQLAFGVGGSIGVLDGGRGRITGGAQAQVLNDQTVIMVPIGYEHVVALPFGPKGTALVPRVTGGYAFQSYANFPDDLHCGLVLPELGVRVPVANKVSVGFDPVSFPVIINEFGAGVSWRTMLSAGLTL